jgi:hypothetical protein
MFTFQVLLLHLVSRGFNNAGDSGTVRVLFLCTPHSSSTHSASVTTHLMYAVNW